MGAFVTFIIPTIFRPTLNRTLRSLIEQTDDDWEALVMNGVNQSPGEARNRGIEQATGEWLAFVDDDDTVTPDYVDALRDRSRDLILFHRRHEGYVLPYCGELTPGNVGIHYAVRRERVNGIRFPTETVHGEEWDFFEALREAGVSFELCPRITYLVWGGEHGSRGC